LNLLEQAATYRARAWPPPAPVLGRVNPNAARARPQMLLYCDVRERLAPLLESGLISAPQTATGGGGPGPFTALAAWTDPGHVFSEHGFGRGWSTTEAHATASMEAYERLLTRTHPVSHPQGYGAAAAFTREDAIRTAF